MTAAIQRPIVLDHAAEQTIRDLSRMLREVQAERALYRAALMAHPEIWAEYRQQVRSVAS